MYINNPLRKPIDLGRWAFPSRVYYILAANLLPRYDRLLVQGMRTSAFFTKDHTDKFECTSIACQKPSVEASRSYQCASRRHDVLQNRDIYAGPESPLAKRRVHHVRYHQSFLDLLL